MKDELFDELAASIREGGAILRGDREASRSFRIERSGPRKIREEHGPAQDRKRPHG